jgi:hypothetical protein
MGDFDAGTLHHTPTLAENVTKFRICFGGWVSAVVPVACMHRSSIEGKVLEWNV